PAHGEVVLLRRIEQRVAPHLGEVALQGVRRDERAERLLLRLLRRAGLRRFVTADVLVRVDGFGFEDLPVGAPGRDGLGLDLLRPEVFAFVRRGLARLLRARSVRAGFLLPLRRSFGPHNVSPWRGLRAYCPSSFSSASRACSPRSGTWTMTFT